ncbi:DUF6404 family protein [uncultured Roseobacter sp.]|uniref:DUF6404 family protein n=1 Tax=uncultured Roseobacter sp. TaxID=114847 RepID=UPI00260E7413|nr:DUF6404 family protein [uncultured Roseobacter sp.]
MSDYQRRFEAAEAELEQAGIWPSNAVPPYTRFLRRLGLRPVPPHYKPLWRSFLGQSVFFTLLMGFVSFSTAAGPDGRSVTEFGIRTVLIGLALGSTMLIYFAYSQWKYALSRWEDL